MHLHTHDVAGIEEGELRLCIDMSVHYLSQLRESLMKALFCVEEGAAARESTSSTDMAGEFS